VIYATDRFIISKVCAHNFTHYLFCKFYYAHIISISVLYVFHYFTFPYLYISISFQYTEFPFLLPFAYVCVEIFPFVGKADQKRAISPGLCARCAYLTNITCAYLGDFVQFPNIYLLIESY